MIERYCSKELEEIFSDQSRFEAYLNVEIKALEGWAKVGKVPDDDVEKIKKKAKVDVKEIQRLEAITKHDVVAFTRQIDENLGEEKRWFHFGLTSTDIVDTALATLYKKADDIIEKDLQNLIASVKEKALEYKETECIGRTHGMHAEITSFGLKWALYYAELLRDQERFSLARKDLECGKISGAVGNFANVEPEVQDYVCQELGLSSALISTQVLQRDRHAFYASVLAILGTTLEKIATEIRLLSQTEIGEVAEGFSKGQKGSSAMPQKKNPVSSENIVGCARVLRGYLIPILEDNALYHERDISHSSVERTALIDEIELSEYMIKRMTNVIDNLGVFPSKMKENIKLTRNGVFAQRVLTAMVEKGWVREQAYDLIQPYAIKAAQGLADFKECLSSLPEIKKTFNEKEFQDLFEDEYFLRNVEVIYKRVGLV
ncbi:MAG: adenylosuccinate lyase [Bacilli bacterium]|jgi:adenylosuccinate lyase|nr:adenylosuccinate lyase [Bacilli bacterium]